MSLLRSGPTASCSDRDAFDRVDALHLRALAIAVALGMLACSPQPHAVSAPTAATDALVPRAPGVVIVPVCDPAVASLDRARVGEADAQRDLASKLWADSKGSDGLAPPPDAPTWDEENRRVLVEDIPEPLRASIAAREAYLRDVPTRCDAQGLTLDYAFYGGDRYFAYGHFADARRLLTPLYERGCTTSPLGYAAWRDLIVMSNLEHDDGQSLRLAEAEKSRPCVGSRTEPDLNWGSSIDYFGEAGKVFDAATKAGPGPRREVLFRREAKEYEALLRAAPAHWEAPTCAFRSAFAYLQIGNVAKATELYEMFVDQYAGVDVLELLEHGGPERRQTLAGWERVKGTFVPAQPQALKERLEQLVVACESLADLYAAHLAYDRAAAVLARLATNDRCDPRRRAGAARRALEFYVALGDRRKATQMHDVVTSSKAKTDDGSGVESDYLLASFDFRQWRPGGTRAGDPATRGMAIGALTRFREANRGRPPSAPYVVEATYRIAIMLQAAGDPTFRVWFKSVLDDWRYFDAHPARVTALEAPWADYRDEADRALHEVNAAANAAARPGILGRPGPRGLPSPPSRSLDGGDGEAR